MSRHRGTWRRALTQFVLSGILWLGVLALSWSAFERGEELGGTAAWAGLLHPVVFGLTGWPVLRRFLRGDRWLTIPNTVLTLSYLAIGLGAIYFVFHYDALGYRTLRRPGAVRPALSVALVGIIAYRTGVSLLSRSGLARLLPSLPRTPQWGSALRISVLTIIALAVSSNLYLAVSGSLGYAAGDGGITNSGIRSILYSVSDVGVLALSGGYFYWFSGAPLSKADRLVLVVATGIFAGFGLLSGMKSEFLIVFFGIIIPYMWTRRPGRNDFSRRAGEFSFGIFLAGVLLLLFSINPLYRLALERDHVNRNRIEQGAAATAMVLDQVSFDSDALPLLAAGAENIWRRLSIFPFHLAVVDQVPETHPYRSFDRYPLLIVTTLIPRIVWPDKPTNLAGADFQRTFISSEVVFFTTPTVYGWSYIEFGSVGVVVVLLFLGCLSGLVETYLAEMHAGKLAAIVLYTALFISLAQIEADPFWLIGGVPKALVVATFVYAVFAFPAIFRKRRWGR